MFKVGIVGLRRGLTYLSIFSSRDDCQVTAICDKDPQLLGRVARESGIPSATTDFEEFLGLDFDIAVVASPAPLHADHSIRCMEAGKNVLSEVPAASDLDECLRLIRTVERTSLTYMMTENCLYYGDVAAWRSMVQRGEIGRVIYAEADYVHDCRELMVGPDGRPTWRASLPPIKYCTHSLGPILDIAKTRCTSASCISSGCNVSPELGAIDLEVAIFQTEAGIPIKVTCGFSVARHPPLLWWCLYGTAGVVEGPRCTWDSSKAYFDGIPNLADMARMPLSRSWRTADAGHGGADGLLVDDYIRSLKSGSPPPIDVYRSVEFTVPGICADLSARKNGRLVEIPDLRRET